jgi:hypothetical protein
MQHLDPLVLKLTDETDGGSVGIMGLAIYSNQCNKKIQIPLLNVRELIA